MSTLIRLDEFGRRARAARILASHETVAAAAEHITHASGVRISERTLGSIERGQQMPTVEQYFALSIGYQPPGGLAFWEPALDERIQALVDDRIAGGPSGSD